MNRQMKTLNYFREIKRCWIYFKQFSYAQGNKNELFLNVELRRERFFSSRLLDCREEEEEEESWV